MSQNSRKYFAKKDKILQKFFQKVSKFQKYKNFIKNRSIHELSPKMPKYTLNIMHGSI